MHPFKQFDDLHDGEIRLIAKSYDRPDTAIGNYAYRYGFSIERVSDDEEVGAIFFALDDSRMQYLRGHLSYGIHPAYRGHHYAAKACSLIKRVALAHGFTRLFLGSDHDNIPSRKTIERLGASPVTIADVPSEEILLELQAQKIDMYTWRIAEE